MKALDSAKWIGCDPACQSPVISREFLISSVPLRAELTVSGLGYYHAEINGCAVCKNRFLPVVSDYEPRDLQQLLYPLSDETTHRIYYNRFDITKLVRTGQNLLTVQLGNGWYRQKERTAEGDNSFGEVLKAIYRLDINMPEGSISLYSDGSETWHASEIVYNNLFIGEIWDPAAVGTEKPVQVLPDMDSVLSEQIGIPDCVIRTLSPQVLGELSGRKNL